MKANDDFVNVVNAYEEAEEPVYADVDTENRPREYEPEWTEYVLDQLADHELVQGAPTVDGLRRVTEKCYGEILESHSEVIESPSRQNPRCTLKHSLVIRKYSTDNLVRIAGCIDVAQDSLPYPFNMHMVATADTRAEGKALRRALKIKVITSEEMQSKGDDEVIDEGKVNDQQILAINQMCKRLDINVTKFVKDSYNKVKTINQISNMEARLLVNKLSEYQRDTGSIEKKIQGYVDSWKASFYKGD